MITKKTTLKRETTLNTVTITIKGRAKKEASQVIVVKMGYLKNFFKEAPLPLGTVLVNRYLIKQFIGMGSYGLTYIVLDSYTNNLYVLKQLRKAKRRTVKDKYSFINEVKIVSKLDHPQIPKLRNQFLNEESLFFVMDFVKGKTFEELIFKDGKKYNEKEAFATLKNVLDILEYIHSRGIIHRDLRIPNIIECGVNKVSIIDFGLAKFNHEKLTMISLLPNEKNLRRSINVKSDFYALGHFILFLLYSNYEPCSNQKMSWEDELTLSPQAHIIIRRMLQIDYPYEDITDLIREVNKLLQKRSPPPFKCNC